MAVRVDENAARAISVRSAIEATKEQVAGDAAIRLAPTRYNLGISRGYQSFAKPTPAPALSHTLSDAGIPNLADFRPSDGAKPDESRFAARVALEEESKVGAAPRTIDSRGDQAVDVAGSYRLTRNLDVTAGVRYSQERDRLAPARRFHQAGQPGGLRRNPVPLLTASSGFTQTPLRRGFSLRSGRALA